MKKLIDWLNSRKYSVTRVVDAEKKCAELGVDLNSAEVFDALTAAGYYFVSGTSDLLIRGGDEVSE